MKKLLLTLLLLPYFLFAQHSIKVTFSPAKDFTWAILYKNSPGSHKYIAQGKIKNGVAVFNLDKKAEKGIYKIVYAVPQEEYNFDIIYNTEEDIEIDFNINTGAVFKKSSENILLNSYLTEATELGKELETAYTKESINPSEIVAVYKKQEELQNTYETKSKGKLVYHFIKANKPYIPLEYESPEVYIENITKNYFTNINYSDVVLQSSNFLLERSMAYMLGVTPDGVEKTDACNQNIDTIYNKVRNTDTKFQKNFFENMWAKLDTYKLTNNANYLAEMYLIPLAQKQNDKALVKKLNQYKNLSIGNQAPEFSWDIIENGVSKTMKLSDIAVAENYILVFWSSTCSHCLKQIPQLKQFVETLDKSNYKVIAVGLEDESSNWEKEIKKYPDFIHVLKLKKWDSKVVLDYGLNATPTYFVLDRNKRFLAKPENLDGLKKFINSQNTHIK